MSEGHASTEVDADRGGLGGEHSEQRDGGRQNGGGTTNGTHEDFLSVARERAPAVSGPVQDTRWLPSGPRRDADAPRTSLVRWNGPAWRA
ncbi:hypothetical protein GCM10010266_54200 [Streptomyces griseomycini]|nr:hypothetical protein GCM10010266_54200 [Streptomyces griseomycini]GGR39208.1 hypothetical protein GCM10015536_51420 [Streptomyces griseomycini]